MIGGRRLERYKEKILNMLDKFDNPEEDTRLLSQIYTIMRIGLEKRSRLYKPISERNRDINHIVTLLKKASPEKVKEILIFVKEYTGGQE